MHLRKVLMHVNIRHNTTAERIMLQIVDNPIHLIHHPFLILMLDPHLITVGFTDGAGLVCPLIPNRTFQIVDVVGLLLPDPQHLIGTTLDCRSPQRNRREFFGQIIAIDHTKFLNCVSACPIFPLRTHLLSFGAHPVVNNIATHIYKDLIC